MNAYQVTLKLLGIGIFGVAMIHIIFGVSSEVFLGSQISNTSIIDANLDSQNRFYGAAFALFGVVFWFASTDLSRYRQLLQAALVVFFVAGLTRLISIVVVGLPSLPVLGLGAIEIFGPPLMYFWLNKVLTPGTPARE